MFIYVYTVNGIDKGILPFQKKLVCGLATNHYFQQYTSNSRNLTSCMKMLLKFKYWSRTFYFVYLFEKKMSCTMYCRCTHKFKLMITIIIICTPFTFSVIFCLECWDRVNKKPNKFGVDAFSYLFIRWKTPFQFINLNCHVQWKIITNGKNSHTNMYALKSNEKWFTSFSLEYIESEKGASKRGKNLRAK